MAITRPWQAGMEGVLPPSLWSSRWLWACSMKGAAESQRSSSLSHVTRVYTSSSTLSLWHIMTILCWIASTPSLITIEQLIKILTKSWAGGGAAVVGFNTSAQGSWFVIICLKHPCGWVFYSSWTCRCFQCLLRAPLHPVFGLDSPFYKRCSQPSLLMPSKPPWANLNHWLRLIGRLRCQQRAAGRRCAVAMPFLYFAVLRSKKPGHNWGGRGNCSCGGSRGCGGCTEAAPNSWPFCSSLRPTGCSSTLQQRQDPVPRERRLVPRQGSRCLMGVIPGLRCFRAAKHLLNLFQWIIPSIWKGIFLNFLGFSCTVML